MKHLICKFYVWSGFNKDIKTFKDDCIICKQVGKEVKTVGCSPIKASRKNEMWELDTVGPLKQQDIKFIVTIIDVFSKRANAFPVINKSVEALNCTNS